MLGIMQYIAPTLQFMLGVAVFHEPFDQTKLIGFSIIWAALLLYWAEGAIYRNRAQAIRREVSAAR